MVTTSRVQDTRAPSSPNIGEDDVDSGYISTQGAPAKAHYSHSASVGGMPRGGAESDHARSGKLKLERGGTHARPTPPANMIYSDATLKVVPDEKQSGGGTAFALDPQVRKILSTKIPGLYFHILKWS